MQRLWCAVLVALLFAATPGSLASAEEKDRAPRVTSLTRGVLPDGLVFLDVGVNFLNPAPIAFVVKSRGFLVVQTIDALPAGQHWGFLLIDAKRVAFATECGTNDGLLSPGFGLNGSGRFTLVIYPCSDPVNISSNPDMGFRLISKKPIQDPEIPSDEGNPGPSGPPAR